MEEFVAQQNIKRYRQLLEQDWEPAQRMLLEKMLAYEQEKLHGGGPSPARQGLDTDGPPAA